MDDDVLWWSVRDGIVDAEPVSLAAPRPLRPERDLSGTSLGVVGSGSVSGEAPRSRPLVLVEVAVLSLGLRPRRAGAGWAGSAEVGVDKKSSSSSSDDVWSFRPSSFAWSRPFLAASTCS